MNMAKKLNNSHLVIAEILHLPFTALLCKFVALKNWKTRNHKPTQAVRIFFSSGLVFCH